MQFLKETKTAIIIMLAVILGSSTISAVSSINSMAEKISSHFYKGSGDNFCIYEDIIDKTEFAYEIFQTADKNGYSDKTVKTIPTLIESIKKEKSVRKLYSLVQQMDSAVNYTVALLADKALPSEQLSILDKARRSYDSESRTIGSDPYNQLVQQFHDEVDGFPGSLFEILANDVEYFR